MLAMDAVQVELLVSLLTDPVFLAVAGGLLLVLTVVLVVVARRLWRRARAFAGANAHHLERARTELRARTLPDGPQRRAVELRRRLAGTVAETDRVLAAAAGHAVVSATLTEQHRELGRLAAALDAHLRDLERDPEPARVEAALPEAAQWTEQLCEVAAELRESVRATTGLHGDDVRALGESTSDGVAALRAGMEFLQRYRTGR